MEQGIFKHNYLEKALLITTTIIMRDREEILILKEVYYNYCYGTQRININLERNLTTTIIMGDKEETLIILKEV